MRLSAADECLLAAYFIYQHTSASHMLVSSAAAWAKCTCIICASVSVYAYKRESKGGF
jgi:hypothetical protein